MNPRLPPRVPSEILELARESVLVTTADVDEPRILYVNPAFTVMTGYEAEDVVGKSPRFLQGPATDRGTLDRLRRCLETGQPFTGEGINYRADQTPFRISWYIEPLRRDGKIMYFVAVQRDVSEIHEAHHRADSLARAMEQLPDGAMIIGRTGDIRFINDAGVVLLATEGLLGKRFDALLDTLDFCPTKILRHLLKGRPWSAERVVQQGAFERTLGFRVSALLDEHQRLDGCVVAIRDLTERKRLDAAAAGLNLSENAAFLFSGIRHELGNPVNSVKSALTVLKSNIGKFPPEKTNDYLSRMLSEIERIEYLLTSLRSYNQLEKPSNRRLDLREHLERAFELLRRDCERQGVVLQTGCEAGLYVQADPRALDQVFINLVTNAVDAMTAAGLSGVVAITARAIGEEVEIAVSDTGPGIDPKDQRAIFEPFVTTKAHGTGMGLVIVRSLVAGMGGAITMKSESGKGTIFRIRLAQGIQ